MAITLYDHGAFVLQAKYVELRKNTYYFRRRIPDDVRHMYPDKRTIDFVSLKTKDPKIAAQRAHQRAAEQDAYWRAIRAGQPHTSKETRDSALALLKSYNLKPSQHAEYERYGLDPDDFLDELRHRSGSGTGEIDVNGLQEYEKLAADLFYGEKVMPFFSDAVELYEQLQGKKSSEKSKANRRKVMSELFAVAGDLPIDQSKRQHANDLVKRLVSKGNKTTTIKRKLNYLAPVMATALREYEIDKKNVFHQLNIPDFGSDTTERQPYSHAELEQLKELYLKYDDDIRWAAAMLHDTGARVAEVIGLRCEDIVLDCKIPYIRLVPHDRRGMKTRHSERDIPLVGTALWAARRAKANAKGQYVFERYLRDGRFDGTHASRVKTH